MREENGMKAHYLLAAAGLAANVYIASARGKETATGMRLNLRTRVEPFKGRGEWREVRLTETIDPHQTAIILCDVWDNHWCKSASRRCGLLATKIEKAVARARAKGIFIIHAPSDCMEFYQETPQRKRMQEAAPVAP